MAVQEKKQAILDWLSNTPNDEYIEAIYDLINSLKEDGDILDSLSADERKKINEGLKDIQNGRVTSHEEVKARYGL